MCHTFIIRRLFLPDTMWASVYPPTNALLHQSIHIMSIKNIVKNVGKQNNYFKIDQNFPLFLSKFLNPFPWTPRMGHSSFPLHKKIPQMKFYLPLPPPLPPTCQAMYCFSYFGFHYYHSFTEYFRVSILPN